MEESAHAADGVQRECAEREKWINSELKRMIAKQQGGEADKGDVNTAKRRGWFETAGKDRGSLDSTSAPPCSMPSCLLTDDCNPFSHDPSSACGWKVYVQAVTVSCSHDGNFDRCEILRLMSSRFGWG